MEFKMLRFFLSLSLLLLFLDGVNAQRYTSNTGRGYMTNDTIVLHKLTNNQDAKPSTQFIYAYLNEVMKDDCVKDDGKIDKKLLYQSLKAFFDNKLDFNGSIRYVLRVFPTCCSSWAGYSPILVDDKYTNDGRMLIWYPAKLHRILAESDYPTMTYYRDIDAFSKTKNLSIIDWRSDIVYEVFDKVLDCFSKYLEEKLERKDIYGDRLKKGDFVSCIEMGFLGPYGEGWNAFYSMYDSPNPFIRIIELYKKYLKDYILIAPGFGMREDITTNPKIIPFQEYLLTTTYGNKNEFGVFIDHLGSWDCIKDFSLSLPDFGDFKENVKRKYKKTPFIGENSGKFQEESKRIVKCINDFKVSMCAPWGEVKLDSSACEEWRKASEILGYVFTVKESHALWDKRKVEVNFEIYNEGVAYCYWDIWLPELIIKERESSEIVSIIDISKEVNLCTTDFPLFFSMHKTVIPLGYYLRHKNSQYDVYLRIIDKKQISHFEFADGLKDSILIGNF